MIDLMNLNTAKEDDLGVEIWMGDYLGYYETESKVRYYSISVSSMSYFNHDF